MKNENFKMKNPRIRAGRSHRPSSPRPASFFIFHFPFFILHCTLFCCAPSPLLADGAERLRGINQYMNREGGDPWSSLLFWLAGLTVATALLIVALRYSRVQRRRRALGHPWRLFRQLLRQLPLTAGQRWQLARIARQVRPDCPASILLTPDVLAAATRQWGKHRPTAARQEMSARLAPVRDVLFGRHLTPPPPDDPAGHAQSA